MVNCIALAAHGEGQGSGFVEDGEEVALEGGVGFLWGRRGEEGGEELDCGGEEGGEGGGADGGLGVGVWEVGVDAVGAAALAVKA